MIKKLANSMASYYAYNQYIPMGEINSYVYGFEILLSTVINIALVLIIASFFHSLFESVYFMGTFILIRNAGGGYHAKSHIACILTFTTIFTVFCLMFNILSNYIPHMYNIACSISSIIIIWYIAPVEAPNKPLSTSKRKRYKKISVMYAFGFLILALITNMINILPNKLIYVFSGEFAASFTLIVGAIKRKEVVYE